MTHSLRNKSHSSSRIAGVPNFSVSICLKAWIVFNLANDAILLMYGTQGQGSTILNLFRLRMCIETLKKSRQSSNFTCAKIWWYYLQLFRTRLFTARRSCRPLLVPIFGSPPWTRLSQNWFAVRSSTRLNTRFLSVDPIRYLIRSFLRRFWQREKWARKFHISV